MKKIFILLLCIFILTGCKFYDEYKMPEEVKIKLNENNYEVYCKKTINDLIKDFNAEVLNGDELIKTSKLGENKVTLEYKYKKRTYKYDITYNVMDTLPPITLRAPSSYYYEINEETTDFCEKTSFIDNIDRNVKCTIDGEYDISTPGTYELEYVFKDKSKNETREKFYVYVTDPNEYSDDEDDYYPIYDNNEEKYEGILFDDIIKLHKNDNTMIGLDISRWQGDIDFNKIKEAGCEFVIIRMAVSNGPDDEIGLDSFYKNNIKKAKKAGLKVGVYVYTAASSKDEIIKQAKFVRKELNKEKLDFPIAYDFESWSDIRELKLNTHDLISYVDEFYNILHKDGYDVMIYSSKNYLEKVWLNEKYPVWLAHYTDQTNYSGNYIMWQMCSDGLIDGIDGNVDIDIYYKKR